MVFQHPEKALKSFSFLSFAWLFNVFCHCFLPLLSLLSATWNLLFTTWYKNVPFLSPTYLFCKKKSIIIWMFPFCRTLSFFLFSVFLPFCRTSGLFLVVILFFLASFLRERTDEFLPFYVVYNMFPFCRTLLLNLLLPHIPYLSHLCLFILQHLFIFLLFNSFLSLSTIIFPICRLLHLFSIFSYHLKSSLSVACIAVFIQNRALYQLLSSLCWCDK